jgi:hypothetical protein
MEPQLLMSKCMQLFAQEVSVHARKIFGAPGQPPVGVDPKLAEGE